MIEAPQRPARPPSDPGWPAGRLLGEQTWSSPVRGDVDERLRRWLLLSACCLLLAALAFLTRPGTIIADTKIDLAVNPLGFLERSLHAWDPAQFGQLQDQAVGYAFPVIPFFVLGKLMALPAWVVQRLWLTAILIAAFGGVVRLSARLGIGTPGPQIAAGLAYALAPRGLSLLGVLSSEFLPAAMLPWILIPLVRAAAEWRAMTTGRRIRVTAQSAAAVALCSGINGAATAAVLLPAVIYLLTAPRPTPRWRILCWWVPAVLLATSWWLYPLLLLDTYGVSILPYTESAAITTSVTSLSDMLRGTEDWITYLVVNGSAWWPVGFRISTEALPTILTGVVAGLGLTGLAGCRMPHRRFLLCVVLAGIFIISAGYVSGLGNPLAGSVDHVINGPLGPFRNLRKFDPLIRLPAALGLASLLASARFPRPRRVVGLAAAAAIALLALPAAVSGLSTAGDFAGVPSYWVTAASWLNRHAGNQAILAVPGARFGQYTWGAPMDDVMEALSTGNWASSQLSAIGSVGNTRLLEAVDQQMAAGDGSAGLTQLLARMGVKYVLVRNDLIRSDLRGAWPARIHQALGESPGIIKVAQFGALPVGSASPDDAVSAFDPLYPPVEIYQVTGAQPAATVQPTAGTLRVYGAPESLLTLADEGVLRNRPVLLNSDSPAVHASSTVVTDSLRRRVRNFGEIRDDYSPTLTAADPASTFEAADDYTEPGWQSYVSVAQYHGIAGITASSSDSGISAIPAQSATGRLPFAAVDGNLSTMWESGGLAGPLGQWINISFLKPVNPGVIGVAFADNRAIGPQVTSVRVQTAAGQAADRVAVTGQYQLLRVPPGPSPWLQITITGVHAAPSPDLGRQVGIAEISVPGITASRTIVAPDVRLPGGGGPTAVVLSKAEPQPSGCMLTSLRWVCSPDLVKPTEEQYGFDQSFTVQRARRARLSGMAVLTDPGLIERYAFPGRNQPRVTASSSYTSDPRDLASSAFDANPLTSWVAGGFDQQPRLTIRWRRASTVRKVTILRPAGAASPLQVKITGARGQVRAGAVLGATGQLSFARMRTDRLTFVFTPAQLPLQVTDVVIPGVQPLTVAGQARFRLPCGLGPDIHLNGRSVPTRASGTFTDVLEGRQLQFSACPAVPVTAGINRVIEPSQDAFSVQTAVIDSTGPASLTAGTVAGTGQASTVRWTDSSRLLKVAASRQSYLAVNENFNAGWRATIGGRTLQPVQLDGWKQGWLLPAGTRGLVTLTYLPDAPYRASLSAGLVAVAAIMILAFFPLRRRRRAEVPAGEVPAGEVPAAAAAAGAAASRAGGRPGWPATALILAAGTGVASFFGLWIGGYPGALLLPAATALFVVAIAFRGTARVCAAVASPWIIAGLLLAAAAAGAVGEHLSRAGGAGGFATWLWDAIPQLLCLVIVGRLAAALLMPDQPVRAPSRDLDAVQADHRRQAGQGSDREQESGAAERGEGAAVEDIMPAQQGEQRVDDQVLPEEHAVRDPGEVPHYPVAE